MISTGADRLAATGWGSLRGRRVGVITNQSGLLSERLVGIVDAMVAAGITVTAVFGPEHGFRGSAQAGAAEPQTVDARTGVTVHDAYDADHDRWRELIIGTGVEVIVVDLPDMGARFFTYASSMHDAMIAAAGTGVGFVVLDRPDPVGGVARGPVLDVDHASFVGRVPVAQAHGLTLGELALMINAGALGDGPGVPLEVIEVQGWRREQTFTDTGLVWVPPSPNLPTPDSALLYPGTGLIEGTNLSEGRGTTRPFQLIGAPWMDERLAAALSDLPGVLARECWFTPLMSKHADELCGGVELHVVDRTVVDPLVVVTALLTACRGLYPAFGWREGSGRWIDLLTGSTRFRTLLDAGASAAEITASWSADLAAYDALRQPFLRYS